HPQQPQGRRPRVAPDGIDEPERTARDLQRQTLVGEPGHRLGERVNPLRRHRGHPTGPGRVEGTGRSAGGQTDTMAETDVHRIFDRVAHLYDTGWLQRALYTAVQDRALAELRARRPDSVLDVGCGTGIFAARLDGELVAGG